MSGLSNIRLKLTPTFTGKAAAEFRFEGPVIVKIPPILLLSFFELPIPFYKISVRLNAIGSLSIKDLAINFQKQLIFKRGYEVVFSKTIMFTTENGLTMEKEKFSLQNMLDSTPDYSLEDFVQMSRDALLSAFVTFQFSLNFGIQLEFISGGEDQFHINVLLNTLINTTVTLDPDSCMVSYIKLQFDPDIHFHVESSKFSILSVTLLQSKTIDLQIKKFTYEPFRLFDPKKTAEVSESHTASSSQSLFFMNVELHQIRFIRGY